jgi:hypothetical protein
VRYDAELREARRSNMNAITWGSISSHWPTTALCDFPLKVLQGESPDFVLVGKSAEEMGLEINGATDEDPQAAMTDAERNLSDGPAIIASSFGYGGDQLEMEWCALVRTAVEKKVAKLSEFKPASRYDVLVPDDTRMGSGDRRKVIQMLTPWVRELKRREPRVGKIHHGCQCHNPIVRDR